MLNRYFAIDVGAAASLPVGALLQQLPTHRAGRSGTSAHLGSYPVVVMVTFAQFGNHTHFTRYTHFASQSGSEGFSESSEPSARSVWALPTCAMWKVYGELQTQRTT